MPVAVIILLVTLIGIAIRRMTRIVIPIWAITTAGAGAALLGQQITPMHAVSAIEPDVMIYLFGVFLIAQAAEDSGYLERLTDTLFYHAHTGTHALFIILFVLGLGAALLMNDTIAILGTPIIIQLCQSHKKLLKPLLFALAFSVTIGSVMSPIGSPQNLLIAVKGEIDSPFFQFIKFLATPTLLNLVVTFLFVWFFYRKTLAEPITKPTPSPIRDPHTVRLVQFSL